LEPFDGGGKAGVVEEGGDEFRLVKIGCLYDAEEKRLKDGVPILADDGALGNCGPVEEGGDGEDDLGDC
jgi:hypothetical protein